MKTIRMGLKGGFAVLLLMVLITSCFNKDKNETSDSVSGEWNFINLSGGFAGYDCDYDEGMIVWSFNNGSLDVENNLPDDGSICNSSDFGLASQSYFIFESGGKEYLFLNNEEVGLMTFEEDFLIIDQNIQSGGTGADGFMYKLKKN